MQQALCACGCGEPTSQAKRTYGQRGVKKGESFRYVAGHQRRGILHTPETKARISASLAKGGRNTFAHRKAYIIREYGVPEEAADDVLTRQREGGVCPICTQPSGDMVVDHAHVDRRFRDVICRLCNWGLGNFRDNPDALRAAAEYIEGHAAA